MPNSIPCNSDRFSVGAKIKAYHFEDGELVVDEIEEPERRDTT